MRHFQAPLLLFGLLFLFSCRNEAPAPYAPPVSEAAAEYVYAHTEGTISKVDPIRIQFAKPVVAEAAIGSETERSVIQLTPKVQGTAVWQDRQTLRFTPRAPMQSAQQYLVTVDMTELFEDIPTDARELQFNFRTRELGMTISTNPPQPASATAIGEQVVEGEIAFTDVVNADKVAKVVLAKQAGNALPVTLAAREGRPNTYQFKVANIRRGDAESAVQLSWKGSPLGIETSGERELIVPPIDRFSIIGVSNNAAGTPYVSVRFSDPLKASQDLKGLVDIANYRGELRTAIENNELRIYGDNPFTGELTVNVLPGIQNVLGRKSQLNKSYTVDFGTPEPGVRLVGQGVIVPNSDGLLFPFEAKGLNAVEVEVFKIFNNNILQFLQYNQLDGSNSMEMVGRVVRQRKVDLQNLTANAQRGDWTSYALKLGDLIREDPEAIYQIRIGFRPDYVQAACTDTPTVTYRDNNYYRGNDFEDDQEFESIWSGYYGINGYYEEYRYSHRNDICYPGYYNTDRFVRRNVVASNLGIIAKGGDTKNYTVVVTDLRSTDPLPGATVRFYDYQQQLIKEAKTDGEGILQTELARKPFLITAIRQSDKGYLRLTDGNALSLSRFDVAGVSSQEGLKGFFYGDRGVWRPGDSLALNFVLESKERLPANYPLQFEWFDPRGVSLGSRVLDYSVGSIYPIPLATEAKAPTGNYRAVIKAGGAEFTKTLAIETVKPNRLKVRVTLPEGGLAPGDSEADLPLRANWLHGAPAGGLRAKMEAQVSSTATNFPQFKDFSFTDVTRSVSGQSRVLFDETLDAEGNGTVSESLVNVTDAPGKLRVNLRTRVFESGGDYSLNSQSFTYDPYDVYVGTRVPENRWGSKRFDRGEENTLQVAAVDHTGQPVSGRPVTVRLYRVGWSWWYDQANGRGNYSFGNRRDAVIDATVKTDAKGVADYRFTPTEYGSYLLRVCDAEAETGHCATERVYVGYPWDDGDNDLGREEAAQLAFTTDKTSYTPGETVTVNVPASEVGRVLLTVENGSEVLQTQWHDAVAGMNAIRFQTTSAMAPNVYAHVELLQPHAQTKNDLPIRMYGVVPITVEDPESKLEPVLEMPTELRPEQTVTLKVSEADGRPMAYTVALVDEGLLDLTNFDTPDAWKHFYAREALGIKTWDLYDDVLGAFGGQLDRLLAIGGDGDVSSKDTEPTANRFEPVVRTLGPFYLEKNKTQTHELTLPNYVGSVKTMVVASNGSGAYGKTAAVAPVKQPLMVLTTLPRVLGPAETLRMPISVFAMEDDVKTVEVTVSEANGLIEFPEGRTKTIDFARLGEQVVEFPVRVTDAVGVANFTISAKSGRHSASQEIELQVRNPNPYINRITKENLQPGAVWNGDYTPVGVPGTNEAVLEISTLPPLNLEKRLDYLLRYPYGCIEQTTSGAFPQLYVDAVLELTPDQRERQTTNIRAAIQRLRQFVTPSGGLAYWPGGRNASPWGTNYAGHFLLEAQDAGYNVPLDLLDGWRKAQQTAAKIWRIQNDFEEYYSGSQQLDQAYRLYTLALAGSPEIGAMNRLREVPDLEGTARTRLAAAYMLAGKPEVGKSLLEGADLEVRDYQETGYTYGSAFRDRAMILEAMVALKDSKRAASLLEDLAKEMGGKDWMSTQETAFGLLAIGKYLRGANYTSGKPECTITIAGKSQELSSDRPVMQVPLSAESAQTVAIRNRGKGLLFTRIIAQGQPAVGAVTTPKSSKIDLTVTYRDMAGQALDIAQLEQGQDFVAEVAVSRESGYQDRRFQELALDQIFPSGWEILNTRLDGLQAFKPGSPADYRDIRDDRVYTFFDQDQQTMTYRIQLNAAYQGRYYLPATDCSAMYDATVHAQVPGRWVEVVRAGTL